MYLINYPYPACGILLIKTGDDVMSLEEKIKRLQDLLDRDPESLNDLDVEYGFELIESIKRNKDSQ